MNKTLVYILIMAAVTYLIRLLPLTLIRKEFTNKTLRSFLYYVPYVTLAVMTCPAIINSTSNPLFGLLAFAVALLMASLNFSLFPVALFSCLTVLLCELIF